MKHKIPQSHPWRGKPLRKPIRKKTLNDKRIMFDKADAQFSIFIRRRGADGDGMNTCFTCDEIAHWKDLHAGHFRHNVLDFDEMNREPQCSGCNTYRSGRLDIFSRKLVLKYGHKAVEALHQRADMALKGERRDYFELEEIYLKYKNENEKTTITKRPFLKG